MADPCCDRIVGGEVYIVVGDQRFEALADVVITNAQVEREAAASSGGRLVVTERAKPVTARIEFANLCDADPVEFFKGRCHVDVTIVEKSRGYRHLLTGASVVGTPETNLATGQVTGIEVATDSYSRI